MLIVWLKLLLTPIFASETVTVQLKWVHQSQFAGFYLAKETGLYAHQDIDILFLEGGQNINPVDALVSGGRSLFSRFTGRDPDPLC